MVEELYAAAKVQVLVCTSTLAWGVNLPCHLVVVKGTEFFDGKTGRYVDFPVTDVLQVKEGKRSDCECLGSHSVPF